MQANSSPDERSAFILATLQREGRLSTSDLSAHFNVSEDSARRDFRELAAKGLIQRVHGAALAVSVGMETFSVRRGVASNAKKRLAQKAATFVLPGQVILFDGGTTNIAIAAGISRNLPFTAITNSPMIAQALNDHPLADVVILGGKFDKRSQMTLGAAVLDAIGGINADICFFGVHGIDSHAGLTTMDFDECVIKQAMIRAASEVIAVATHDKVGTAAPYRIGRTDLLTGLITEASAKPEILGLISENGTNVVRV